MVAGTRLIVTLYVHCLGLVTETGCVYCTVRTEFCQTIHQCSVITFIQILLLLEAGPSLATFKRSSAVPDDGGALDGVELRHCLLIEEIQEDATVCRYLLTAKLLYMFRASIVPIIRST